MRTLHIHTHYACMRIHFHFICSSGSSCPFFDASVVRYPSSYTYPATYETRSLTPVPGYAAGSASFTGFDVSSVLSVNDKYFGGVLHTNGKICCVPLNADNIGEFDPVKRTFSVIGERSWSAGESGGVFFIPDSRGGDCIK